MAERIRLSLEDMPDQDCCVPAIVLKASCKPLMTLWCSVTTDLVGVPLELRDLEQVRVNTLRYINLGRMIRQSNPSPRSLEDLKAL